jgi:hypothetical protein
MEGSASANQQFVLWMEDLKLMSFGGWDMSAVKP